MDFNLKKEIKSKMFSYYKAKSKKKSDSNISNYNNNPLYVNDLFNKNLKVRSDLKFRTTKNSPVYSQRKIEVNEDMNSGIFAGGRLKNANNDELLSKKIKKLYKKNGNFSQLHNNSSNLISNNSKNESNSITNNKLNKTKKLFYNNYNNSNFDYNDKLNYCVINNNSEENNNNIGNNNISSIKQKKNFKSNLGLIKHLENKEAKTKNEALFKKITPNEAQIKHQSVNKAKKITNINYIYKNNSNNYSKYLKKINNQENNTSGINGISGVNILTKKLDKILHNNDYNNSFLDYNKLSKTAYLSKNNSNKNSLEKKTNIKNNYNIYFINSKLIQRNDDKNINSINNINNNESSRILYDSINKKIKNINELNSSNNKNSTKTGGGGHNYSQIYILDSNNKSSNTKIANEENITNNINNQVSLYNYINSTGKHMHPIKSTPDIASSNNNINNVQKSSQISSLSNNINKINGLQNLNLNSISNNNTNAIESNSNTNRTSNKTIHFRSNSNLYNNINNSKEASDIIYKKKLSVKQKDVKSSSLHSNRSNSQIEDDTSNTKIKSARGLMPKQETIKAKLVKNLLPFSNYQSPVEKKQKKIINNYMIDSKKIREGKLLNKGPDADSDIYNHENKSTSLINNNYYIGINLDKKIINNICHTFRENNNYFNCNLISNNNEAQEISSDNRNLKIINDTSKTSKINNLINNETNINNNDTLKDNKKKGKYFNSNSQEFIKGFTKKNTTEKLTIEINKRENEKKKLFIDNKIRIKQKDSFEENKYPNDMLYIPPNKELKQETVHLTTTTSLDCYYYKNEKEKLYKFIRQYYSEHKAYPDTQKHFYLYGRQIGHGAFGKVNIALHVASGRLVAIKSFNKKNLKKKNAKQKINNEIEMLSRLRHPFISQILDSFETETHIFIVMEYICGDLLGFIRKRGKLSETVSKIIFKQLIEGLKYIHKKKIVHRDIKLDNILIDLTNTIKICDFGVSRKISKDEIMHEHCGTPAYIAPEIFENNGYTGFQCDIWSAGVTLYYILGGIQPFRASSIKDLEKKVIAGDFEPIEEVSEEANNLIKLMLKTDPKKRINEDKILNHPWLVNIKTENRKKLNLFTEAEKILLSKYDVDYLTSDKEELIENFTMKNLETNENENIKNAVGGTKSVIYAPYNTYIEPNEDQSIYKSFIEVQRVYKEIEIHNDICKYGFKVQQANIKYELSNNQDFDNGIIKTQKDEDLKHQNEKIEKIAFKGNNSNNLFYNKNYTEKWNDDSYEDEDSIKINEKIVNDIEKTVGYDKNYVINCLKKNVINYATATYYLLARENNNEDNNMYGNFV